MVYRLDNGRSEFMTEDNCVYRLRDIIYEELGDDMARCFDKVLSVVQNDLEEQAIKKIEEHCASVVQQLEEYMKKCSVKTCDSIAKVQAEIVDFKEDFYLDY